MMLKFKQISIRQRQIRKYPTKCPAGDKCKSLQGKGAAIYESKDITNFLKHMKYCCPLLMTNYDRTVYTEPRWFCSNCGKTFTLKNKCKNHIDNFHLEGEYVEAEILRIEPISIEE